MWCKQVGRLGNGHRFAVSCSCWGNKTTNTVKQHIWEHFPYRRSLATEQLLGKIKKGKLFGYMQCDIEVPEFLRSKFDNFPPVSKNTLVSKNDIVDLMKTYAEEERIMSQTQKLLILSFTLQNGTHITPLLLFYLQLGLVCTKILFVEYTPKNCFNSFVQSAVMQESKVTKIQIQVSSQKQWSFYPTAPTVTRSRTGANTQ